MIHRLSSIQLRWDNITKAALISFFSSLYFYLPISTLWYQSHGLSLMQVEMLGGIGGITFMFTTVATGMFADKYGRKSAIVVALLFQLLGEVLFLFSSSFFMFMLCAISAGLGFSFWGGAFDAMIVDTLKEKNKQEEMQKIFGSLMAYRGLSTILGAGVSSLIVSQLVQERFIFAILLTIGSVSIALLMSLWLKEPKHTEFSHKLSPKELLAKSIALLKHNRKLGRLVVLAVVTTPFTGALITLYQPYFQNVGVSGYWFGLAYAIGGFLLFLSSKYVYLIEKKFGGKISLLVFTILPGIFFGLMAAAGSAWLAVTFFCLNYGSSALQQPLFDDYTNRHIASENRATLLSFIAMLSSFYVAVMGPIIGSIADRSLPIAFFFMGALITFGAIVFRIDDEHVVTEEIGN